MQPTEPISREITLISAVWRYKWLVVAWAVVLVAAAVVYVSLQAPSYQGTALLVIEDPRSEAVFGQDVTAERFVRDRIAILRSESVARRASQLAPGLATGVVLSTDEILKQQDIRGFEGSDLIEINFIAATPEDAIAGANSIALGYEELLREEGAEAAAQSLANIDAALVAVRVHLDDIAVQISEKRNENQILSTLDGQLQTALAELAILQNRLTVTTDPEALAATRSRLADIRAQIETFRAVQGVSQQDPELAALEREQADAINRQATLSSRSTEIALDSQVAGSGVALTTPAESAAPTTALSRGRAVAVAIVAAIVSGAGFAYFLTARRRTVTDRTVPEAVLNAPLLSEIPDFQDEGLKSTLPVRDAPRSASAEAYRFAAVTVDIAVASKGYRSLVVVSSTLGAGKTTAVANTAIAVAREGNRVLVIDADFGNQEVTKLLADSPDVVGARGMTDIDEAAIDLHQVLWKVSLGEGVSLNVLSRGTRPLVAADYFRGAVGREVFEAAREEFDLVLVDGPPLLQVAYASTLVGYADASIVVVEHGSPEADLDRIAERLRLIGRPIAGYVFNKAPLRREMTMSEGSLADILGDQQDQSGARRQRRARSR